MTPHFIQKSWLSPFLAVSFFAVASTGIVLLFHGRLFLVMVLHECLSVLFCIAGALHTWANWRPLLSYFRHRRALLSVTVGVSLTALFLALAEAHSSTHDQDSAEICH